MRDSKSGRQAKVSRLVMFTAIGSSVNIALQVIVNVIHVLKTLGL
jgi:hypothetical protein